MLAVEYLSPNLSSTIKKIVQEYEHQTSFASLAFLSTPEDSAETQLAPLLANYVDFLQQEWGRCVWECRLEGTLARALNPGMRKVFKTVEFRSIGHLLEVCHGFRDRLENIVITSKDSFDSSHTHTADLCSNPKAIKQALRDLRRETIIVNGQILPPVQSLKELIKLLRERLNSKPMKLKEKKNLQKASYLLLWHTLKVGDHSCHLQL